MIKALKAAAGEWAFSLRAGSVFQPRTPVRAGMIFVLLHFGIGFLQ